MDVEAGIVTIEDSAACPTVIVVEVETEPEVAVMFAVPSPALVANPFVPEALLMMTTVADDELHVTTEVTSRVLPSV